MFKKILQFFIDSKNELTKVVWPTRRQAIEMLIAVIVIVIVVSLYLGALDYIFTRGLTLLLKK